MNDKITLPALIQLLALRTGDSKKQAEDFIKSFFKEISDILAEGDSVKLKGIGIFKLVDVEARKSVNVSTGEAHEIPAHRKVVFVADKELALAVNEPFSMFETVELPDDDELQENDRATNEEIEDTYSPKATKDDQDDQDDQDEDAAEEDTDSDFNVYTYHPDDEEDDDFITFEQLSELDSAPMDKIEPNDSIEPNAPVESNSPVLPGSPVEPNGSVGAVKPVDMADITEDEHNISQLPDDQRVSSSTYVQKSRFGIGFLTGAISALALCAVICCIVYFVFPEKLNISAHNNTEQNDTDSIYGAAMVESVESVGAVQPGVDDTVAATAVTANTEEIAPTKPSDANPNESEITAKAETAKVYDTITKSRYLTTMAKDHYGNFNLWPYIYEENKAILGHPDRIKPGTQVVVPDLKKYGVDPTNPKDIAKAKRKGVEIYSRYK